MNIVGNQSTPVQDQGSGGGGFGFSNLGKAIGSVFKGAGNEANKGGDVALFTRIMHGDPHTIRDAQTWLNAKGYKIAVDGVWGPQTARALKASFQNIHPNAHNVREVAIANKHPQTGKFQAIGSTKLAKAIGGKGGGKGGNVSANVSATMPGLINPSKAAQAMANAEYNPAIASLKQALADVVTQGKYDQGQLSGYYTQMENLMNSQNAAQGNNTAQELQNVTGDMGNVAQLFGGANAQQMQPALGNATGLISAEGKSEQDYLTNMLPLLQAQAAQGSSNLSNAVQAQQNNYQNQLTQQQQAKGSAYNADYQQALSNQATQEQNQLALQQAQALFPSQLSAAQSTAAADRANAAAAPAYNRAHIQAQLASAQHSQALSSEAQSVIQKNLAYARKAAMGGNANVLAPGTTSFERIQSELYRSMTNSRGKVTITNPMQAQHALYAQAVAAGLIDKSGKPLVKGAVNLLNSTLANMYQRDVVWQKGFKWNGTRFVPRSK